MASASRDKFSRDDEPELGDIDASVLGELPVELPEAAARSARKPRKRVVPAEAVVQSGLAELVESATPVDVSSRGSAAVTATTAGEQPAGPAHTFGWTRVIFWPLVLAFVALQYRLWVGEGSFAEVWRLKLEIEKQEQENHVLAERNRRLAAEVRDLREGGAAVEERARKQLGMVKEDETLYIIHPKSP